MEKSELKKSEMYRHAQFAVLEAVYISDADKLAILQELAFQERCAKTCEELQAEKERKEKESEVPC